MILTSLPQKQKPRARTSREHTPTAFLTPATRESFEKKSVFSLNHPVMIASDLNQGVIANHSHRAPAIVKSAGVSISIFIFSSVSNRNRLIIMTAIFQFHDQRTIHRKRAGKCANDLHPK
ncbi:MAG: hypothetical protein ACKO5E_05565 [bacterium]